MVRPRLVGLVLILTTLVLYWPVWQFGFISYDDPEYVAENRIVQAGLTANGFNWAFTKFHASNWHPLTWLSHMADCQFFGPEEGAHHFVNVLFHIANAILFFVVWHRMTGSLWPAALVAALFAWHPLHVESVAWVSERKDVLSTFFCAWTLYFYARYAREPGIGSLQSSFRSKNYCATFFCFALALLAKPMPVTLPFVLLLLDYWPLNRVFPAEPQVVGKKKRMSAESPPSGAQLFVRLVLEKLPFLVLVVGSCVITVFAQRSGRAVATLTQFDMGLRFSNAATAYWRYLEKTFWPVDLAVLYPMPPHIPVVVGLSAATGLVLVSVVCWRLRQRAPALLIGWLWFVGTLVPVIGLLQVGSQSFADRYTYVPLLGVFVMIAFGLPQVAKGFFPKPAVAGGLAALALAGCLFATARQVPYWRDSETLFTRTVAVTKDNGIARLLLADALARKGRTERALAEYHEAARLMPELSQIHNNLAMFLRTLGRFEEALPFCQNALRLEPDVALYHANLGEIYAQMERPDDALRCFAEAARLEPGNAHFRFLLGRTRMRQGLGQQAISYFQEALKLDPENVDSLTFWSRVLAASGDSALRNGPQAVTLAQRANELSGGREAYVLDTLAVALAETGRFDLAQQIVTNALTLALENQRTNLAVEIEKRLKLYQAGIPFRETNAVKLNE